MKAFRALSLLEQALAIIAQIPGLVLPGPYPVIMAFLGILANLK